MKTIIAESPIMRLVLIFLLILLSGCDEVSRPVESERVFTSTDPVLLAKFISLPRQPLSARWEVVEIPARGTGNLTVLLKFSAQDRQFILNNSKPFELQDDERMDVEFYDTWLPAVAKAGIKTRLQGESYQLHGVMPMQPDLFTHATLSPYVNGKITPLANGFILVWLYSM